MTIQAEPFHPSSYEYGTISKQDAVQQQTTTAKTHSGSNDNEVFAPYVRIGLIYATVLIFGLICLLVSAVAASTSSTSSSNQTTYNDPIKVPLSTPPSSKVLATLNMPQQGPLMDLIHIIDDETSTKILSEISTVELDVPGCEIRILLVNNIKGKLWSSPKQFATALFNMWELGSKETNNGVLILFLLDRRRIEVEVGVRLNVYMDQSWTENMLNSVAVPNFKNGDYGSGILNIVDSVADRLREIEDGMTATTASQEREIEGGTTATTPRQDDDDSDSVPFYCSLVLMLCLLGCGIYNDSKYPMGRDRFCTNCGQCNWTHQRWVEITQPTHHTKGLKRRYCVCNSCQTVDTRDVVMTSDDDSDNTGGGGGGSSDGGGGGGASW